MAYIAYVHSINIKPETEGERGLPKIPVCEAAVGLDGVVGDYNRSRTERKNCDMDRALLLLPLETLDDLQKEGWPVKPGHLGENITTLGIPYGDFAPGKK